MPFLSDTRLAPNPARITYAYTPDALDGLNRQYGDYPKLGLVAARAYWVWDVHPHAQEPSCHDSTAAAA